MRSREIEEYKEKLALTDTQREVLVGLILGDAHLETKDGGKTYRVKIEQSIAHIDYVMHLYEVFKPFVRTPPQERVVKRQERESVNIRFQTLSHSCFRFYAQQFYGNGKKSIPNLIHRWLSPQAIAYWFMDDGSIKSSQSKAVIFNTQGFRPPEVSNLCQILEEKFQLKCKPRQQKDGQQIYISGDSYETLSDIISPFLIESMKYKFPKARQTQLPKK